MPRARTITGKEFEYFGSLDTGLMVQFKNTAMKITPDIVRVIRNEISRRSPVLMGACYKPLVADSVGETLWMEHGVTPQVMSYVLPLLVEEKFCRVSDNKPFKIYLNLRR
jgi:hypothetical protein